MTRSFVIIGGGIGGLSAAIRLAAAEHPVTVIEQYQTIGGKVSEIAANGFRWDTGPSVISMRPVIDELFQYAGKSTRDYLSLLPVDPLARYFWADGSPFDASRMPHLMLQRLREFVGDDDARGYMHYLQYARGIHDILSPAYIYDDPPPVWPAAKTPLPETSAVDPLRTMAEAIDSFVASPKLRQMLKRYATYVGASPYSAPDALNMIAHIALSGGVWYPQGGVYSVARALERLAAELGVTVITGCRVDEIKIKNHRVIGLLANGEFFPADAVIANIDAETVYQNLLPQVPFNSTRLERPAHSEYSSSCFVLMLGVEGTHPQLAHHNILFSDDDPREFADIFERQLAPEDPTLYIAITSKTESSHAPEGCENWFVRVNVPSASLNLDWRSQSDRYRDHILGILARRGLDIRARIRAEYQLPPPEFETKTEAQHGALYELSPDDRLKALRRPPNRSPDIRGLYFTGGTTHSGTGVPLAMLSGKMVAKLACADLERTT
ncbi:MAG: phytoene desaturase [Anaerolineae bacterium]|nr:phytoene desaturase [Anaerolineae bacterium]